MRNHYKLNLNQDRPNRFMECKSTREMHKHFRKIIYFLKTGGQHLEVGMSEGSYVYYKEGNRMYLSPNLFIRIIRMAIKENVLYEFSPQNSYVNNDIFAEIF